MQAAASCSGHFCCGFGGGMRTSSAKANGWRCPKCDDGTEQDRAGKGFVRHLTNPDCDFERGLRDEVVATTMPLSSPLQFATKDTVCHAFIRLATTTWNDLKDWNEIGEESITDYRLRDLKRDVPASVRILKFSKWYES